MVFVLIYKTLIGISNENFYELLHAHEDLRRLYTRSIIE